MDKRKFYILVSGGFLLLCLLGRLICSVVNFSSNIKDGLGGISLNGMYLGDRVSDKMKEYFIMDNFKYSHEYNNILFSYDSEDKIDCLGFYSSWGVSGNIEFGIDDIVVKYKGHVMNDLDDFERYFGEGKITSINNKYTGISFFEDDLELYLQFKDDVLINIELGYK